MPPKSRKHDRSEKKKSVEEPVVVSEDSYVSNQKVIKNFQKER